MSLVVHYFNCHKIAELLNEVYATPVPYFVCYVILLLSLLYNKVRAIFVFLFSINH